MGFLSFSTLHQGNKDDGEALFATPIDVYSPAYHGLTNNVATRLMKTKLHEWPEGTEDYVNHRILKEYIQGIAKKTGVEDSTVFGAKVTKVEKEGKTWSLTYETLAKEEEALAGETWIREYNLVGAQHKTDKRRSDV